MTDLDSYLIQDNMASPKEKITEEDKHVGMQHASKFLLLTRPHFTCQQEMKLHWDRRFGQREKKQPGIAFAFAVKRLSALWTSCYTLIGPTALTRQVGGKKSVNHRQSCFSVFKISADSVGISSI